MSLLVIVPTRGRRAQCERMLESFRETASPGTDIVYVMDPDDAQTYDGVDWDGASVAVLEPRGTTIQKVNQTAEACLDAYDAIMFNSDDMVYKTPHWDTIMLKALADLGGHGWIYPEDKRRNDIPEHYLVDTGLIRTLGWYANPLLNHYYMADTIAILGRKTGLLRYCPQVVIEHLHYTISGAERDETYRYAEETWGQADLEAFHAWQVTDGPQGMPHQVARLRREYSRDVEWVLSRV